MRRGAYALAHGPPAYTGKGAGRKINASPYKGSEGPKGVIPKLFLEESRIRRGSHLHRKCQIFAAACTCWVAGASPRPTVVIPARGCRARNPVVRTNRPRPQSCCKPAPHCCHSRAWLPREESRRPHQPAASAVSLQTHASLLSFPRVAAARGIP